MITIKSGPGFKEPRTLAEQLEASQYLVRPEQLPTEYELTRIELELDALVHGVRAAKDSDSDPWECIK